MVTYLTDVRGERVVALNVTWFVDGFWLAQVSGSDKVHHGQPVGLSLLPYFAAPSCPFLSAYAVLLLR
jgi:hypothetical protein